MQSRLTVAAKLITPAEAAEFLNVKVQTLSVWRSSKRYGLPYLKVGNAIRYRLADLEKWLESRTVSGVDK
jgi:excisionase family DNA binding protein